MYGRSIAFNRRSLFSPGGTALQSRGQLLLVRMAAPDPETWSLVQGSAAGAAAPGKTDAWGPFSGGPSLGKRRRAASYSPGPGNAARLSVPRCFIREPSSVVPDPHRWVRSVRFEGFSTPHLPNFVPVNRVTRDHGSPPPGWGRLRCVTVHMPHARHSRDLERVSLSQPKLMSSHLLSPAPREGLPYCLQ